MRYLLDTNVLSELCRKQPSPNVLAAMERHSAECAIASVTWHELNYGCDRLEPSQRQTQLRAYIESVGTTLPILPYDAAAAKWHGMERARLSRMGLTPAFADGQIAAITMVNGLILVTNNVRDFQGFEGLTVENWFMSL